MQVVIFIALNKIIYTKKQLILYQIKQNNIPIYKVFDNSVLFCFKNTTTRYYSQ